MQEWITLYWLEVFFGVLTAGGVAGYRSLNRRLKRHDALELGVQALLRDRIYQAYFYHYERGYYPVYARENVEALFDQYKALGGNGTVHDLVDRLHCLPVRKTDAIRGEGNDEIKI